MKPKRQYILAALVVVAVLVAGGFAVNSFMGFQERTQAPAVAAQQNPEGIAQIPLEGAVVFRDTRATDNYGKVAWAPLDSPNGTRTDTGLSCDRVYRTGGMLSCLSALRGMNTSYDSTVYSIGGHLLSERALPGEPSRTRVSPTGMVGVTAFITGESYDFVGFSTETVIAVPGGTNYGNLQDFDILVGGTKLTAADRNVWGVTFAKDAQTFYATAASGKQTWLVQGSLRDKTLTAIGENAECPSISPDGKLIAYKKRRADSAPAHWDIAVLDIAKRTETLYPLESGFDDQLEWLDADTLLFGQPREETPGDADIFSLDLVPGATPKVFIEHAWSPSIQR
ncbi:PD40 domain-containing protein [Arthrobacter sp. UCD-GKA]|uniref:PD40 domain-containing protein n=1 Tax=Arthrobacter sp. UCD-GKA TaxID=1913576 RepID=UPI000A9A9067|nr:PD40 domain-containing protein [Arthrobacter sp. UCD-GKA]